MRDTVIQEVLKHKIIAIVRGMDKEQTVNIAKALYEGGIRFIEVTFNQRNRKNFIRPLIQSGRSGRQWEIKCM